MRRCRPSALQLVQPRLDLDHAASSRPAAGVGRAIGARRHRALGRKRSCEEGSHRRTVELAGAGSASERGADDIRRLALEPARAVVGPGVGAVVGLAGDVQAELLEHRPVLLGRVAERGQEVAHHHAVEPGLDRRGLELAEVLDPAAAQAEQGLGQDQAEDRDPLDDLPRIHQLAVAELRPGRGLRRLIGTLVGSIAAS